MRGLSYDVTLLVRMCMYLTIILSLALPRDGASADIQLTALTIREGLESQITFNWPLEDKKKVYQSKYFREMQQLALKAGIELIDSMDQPAIAVFNNTRGILHLKSLI